MQQRHISSEGWRMSGYVLELKLMKEKSPHTRRYRETERKLMRVAYRISSPARKKFITVRELVRQAKIGTSTFYRHFRNLLDFSRRHEKILTKAAEQLLVELSQKGLPKEVIFFKVNRMIYLNRASVRLLLANGNDRAIRQVFWTLRPLIVREWPTYGRGCDRKIYCFFVAGATEAMKLWATNHSFRQGYVEDITRQLIFLSKTIAPSLAPLAKIEEEKGLRVAEDYV